MDRNKHFKALPTLCYRSDACLQSGLIIYSVEFYLGTSYTVTIKKPVTKIPLSLFTLTSYMQLSPVKKLFSWFWWHGVKINTLSIGQHPANFWRWQKPLGRSFGCHLNHHISQICGSAWYQLISIGHQTSTSMLFFWWLETWTSNCFHSTDNKSFTQCFWIQQQQQYINRRQGGNIVPVRQ